MTSVGQSTPISTSVHKITTATVTLRSTIGISTTKPLTSSKSGSSKTSSHAASTTSKPPTKKRDAHGDAEHCIPGACKGRIALETKKPSGKRDVHDGGRHSIHKAYREGIALETGLLAKKRDVHDEDRHTNSGAYKMRIILDKRPMEKRDAHDEDKHSIIGTYKVRIASAVRPPPGKRDVHGEGKHEIYGDYKMRTALETGLPMGKRSTHDEDKHNAPRTYKERTALETKKVPAKNNFRDGNAVLLTRQLKPGARALIDSTNSDEGSVVLISYFGICASNTTTSWSCTKKRNRAPSLDGAPLTFLELGGSLQGAISPLPPIIAVALQGTLVLLSCFLGFRSSTGLQTRLGKVFVVLAFAAFSASIFTAILFQSASGMIYSAFTTSDTIVVSKGSSGISLAWAGVFFTGLAMAGVITLVLFADAPKISGKAKKLSLVSRFFDYGGKQERDIEMPPVYHSPSQNEIHSSVVSERRELRPQKGNFRPESPAQKVHSERVENMRRGNSPFGNGWNMI